MSIPENFKKLVGKWDGTNRLHTPWIEENPINESDSDCSGETGTVSTVAVSLKILKPLDYNLFIL